MKKIVLSLVMFVSLCVKSQGVCTYNPCLPFRSGDLYQQADILSRILSAYGSTVAPCTYSPCIPYRSSDEYQIGDLLNRVLTSITNTSVSGWSLTGNSGTSPGTNFLGTTDSRDLVFKTNNSQRLAISPTGIFTISSTASTTNVNGTFYYDPSFEGFYWYHSDATGSSNNGMIANSQRALGFYMPATSQASTPYGVQFSTSDATGLGFAPNGNLVMGANTGSAVCTKPLRIGSTTAPTYTLHVAGDGFFSKSLTGTDSIKMSTGTSEIMLRNLVSNTSPAIYMLPNNISKKGNNYSIFQNAGALFLNDANGANTVNLLGNNSVILQAVGDKTTGVNSTFVIQASSKSGATASTEARNFVVAGGTRGWLTGAIALQRANHFTNATYSAVAASVMTDAYAMDIEKAVAGTNITITNNWGIRSTGLIQFPERVRIGNTAVPVATLDVNGNIACSTTFSCGTNATITGTSLHTGAATFVAALTGRNSIWSSSKTAGIGYAVGSGSTVTQTTSRTNGVTINAITGAITLVSAAGSASYQTFTVTNSAVTAKDVVIMNQQTGADIYLPAIIRPAAGSFQVSLATTGGTTVESPVFNFVVIKGQTD